jgi:hypothetical protein
MVCRRAVLPVKRPREPDSCCDRPLPFKDRRDFRRPDRSWGVPASPITRVRTRLLVRRKQHLLTHPRLRFGGGPNAFGERHVPLVSSARVVGGVPASGRAIAHFGPLQISNIRAREPASCRDKALPAVEPRRTRRQLKYLPPWIAVRSDVFQKAASRSADRPPGHLSPIRTGVGQAAADNVHNPDRRFDGGTMASSRGRFL